MDCINEFNLKFSAAGNTFINTAGQEFSEIDYFPHQAQRGFNMSEKKVLRNIDSNTSDHLPIHISIVCGFQELDIHQSTNQSKNKVKIK